MQKLISFFTISMLFASVLFQSCKGLPGTNGAQGNTGATGAQGPQGPQGASGTSGKDGNANVQGRIFTFQPSEWIKKPYGTAGKYNYSVAAIVSEITQSVVDKGMIIAYRSNGGGGYVALPSNYSFEANSKTYVLNTDIVHYVGGVTFWRSDSDGFTLAPSSTEMYKVVVVTPQGRIANPDVNYKNYAEVAKAFDLE